MSRPTVVYLVMILVLAAGLWVVLHFGAGLSAPEDLAGKWKLQSSVHGIPVDVLSIEQSGRFFQVSFDRGPRQLDLKMTDEAGPTLKLTNSQTKLTVSGAPGSDEKTIELSGTSAGRWLAHRTDHTFPADTKFKEGH